MNSSVRMISTRLIPGALMVAAIAGCSGSGELVVQQGIGITAVRTTCPAVGIPDYTGNITTFRDGASRTVNDMDIVASMTNLRSTCDDSGNRVYTNATFDVLARRTDTRGNRRVELPYFSTVVRGTNSVVTKRIGTVVIDFADGQERAQGSGVAGAFVDRAEATLPAEVRERITKRRKPGDPDAALDPLANPEVREAVNRASFELLVGFQLTEPQLAFNATR